MMDILKNIWSTICSWYHAYTEFVYDIFPKDLGDLVVWIINIAVACLIVKIISSVAFKTKTKN